MANPNRRLAGNAPGPWFVDDTCMGCDASRQCAPELFVERDGQTVVARQPSTPDELRAATRALLSCPTSSIGAGQQALDVSVFPEEIEPGSGVFLTGFNSPKAYGGNTYFVQRPHGNLLIDGPRWTSHLEKAFRARGGLSHVLLTHRDDIGDSQRYAEAFGATCWIHAADRGSAPFARELTEALRFDGLEVLPMPGHTRGSVMFLVDRRFLFTGDSLFWSRGVSTLHAHRAQCWYSWPTQRDSLATLTNVSFEWVLPGHGGRMKRATVELHQRLSDLVTRMDQPGWSDAW